MTRVCPERASAGWSGGSWEQDDFSVGPLLGEVPVGLADVGERVGGGDGDFEFACRDEVGEVLQAGGAAGVVGAGDARAAVDRGLEVDDGVDALGGDIQLVG